MKALKLFLAALLMSAAAIAPSFGQNHRDALANDMYGHVRSVIQSEGGQSMTLTFTNNGDIENSPAFNKSYDANGYLLSYCVTDNGTTITAQLRYDGNHRLQEQVMSANGGTISQRYTYNSEGFPVQQTITQSYGGQSQSFTINYTYQLKDGRGNWLKRTASANGETLEQSREITYW